MDTDLKEKIVRLERENKHLSMQLNELKKPQKLVYYLLIEPWAVYVKEGDFFRDQGGLTENWGKRWEPVVAADIEAARAIGIKLRDSRDKNNGL